MLSMNVLTRHRVKMSQRRASFLIPISFSVVAKFKMTHVGLPAASVGGGLPFMMATCTECTVAASAGLRHTAGCGYA